MFNNNNNNFKFIIKFLVIILLINTSLETNSLRANTNTSNITCDSTNKPKTCNLSTLYKLISPLFKDIKPTLSDLKGDYCKYINHQNPANLDTVLMSAAATGQLDTINALIGCNSNPDFKNHKDYTALDFAQSKLSSNPSNKTYQDILNSLKQVTTCRTDVTSDNSCLPGFNNIDCCSGYTCDPNTKTCKGSNPSCANKGESCTIDSNCCTGLTCQSSKCATPSAPTCGKETQACCANNVCNDGLTCQSGICSAPTCCKALGDTCDPSDTTCDKTTFTCDPDTKKCKNTPVDPPTLSCCKAIGKTCDPSDTTCDKTTFTCDQSTSKCIKTPVTPVDPSSCSKLNQTCSGILCCDKDDAGNSLNLKCDISKNICVNCLKTNNSCDPQNDLCCSGLACNANKKCVDANASGPPGNSVQIGASQIVASIGLVVVAGVISWRLIVWNKESNKKLQEQIVQLEETKGLKADLQRSWELSKAASLTYSQLSTIEEIKIAIQEGRINGRMQASVIENSFTRANREGELGTSGIVKTMIAKILESNPGAIKIPELPLSGEAGNPTITFTYTSDDGDTVHNKIEVSGTVLSLVNPEWESIVRAAGPGGPPVDGGLPSVPTDPAEIAAFKRYVDTEWNPGEINFSDPLSNSFDNWKDFADENPALSRELYGLARYINSFDDPNIETLRSIVEILNSKGIINLESDTPKEDIVNFFNTNGGLFGYHEGNETFTLNFSREIAWDSGQFAISARYFDSPGFEDFRDEAFQLIGRNMQTDDMYLKAQAYQAWQEENQGIRDAGAESRFEPEV